MTGRAERREWTRLLLDEMYPPRLAELLRGRHCDVVAVTECAELVGIEDHEVLAHAAAESRCVVTENVRDFAALAHVVDHHGILLVHPRRWPRHRAGVAALAEALAAAIEAGYPGGGEVDWLR